MKLFAVSTSLASFSSLRKISSREDLAPKTQDPGRFARQTVLRGPSAREKHKKHRRSVPSFICLANEGDLSTTIGRSYESLIEESEFVTASGLSKENPKVRMAGSDVNLFSMQSGLPGLHLGQIPTQQRKHSFYNQDSKGWRTVSGLPFCMEQDCDSTVMPGV